MRGPRPWPWGDAAAAGGSEKGTPQGLMRSDRLGRRFSCVQSPPHTPTGPSIDSLWRILFQKRWLVPKDGNVVREKMRLAALNTKKNVSEVNSICSDSEKTTRFKITVALFIFSRTRAAPLSLPLPAASPAPCSVGPPPPTSWDPVSGCLHLPRTSPLRSLPAPLSPGVPVGSQGPAPSTLTPWGALCSPGPSPSGQGSVPTACLHP